MVYLCFDFGTSSWGCAVGDDLTQTATAIGGIKAQSGVPDWDYIASLVETWQPAAFVIGYPLKLDGERFKLTDLVDDAINKLTTRYPHLSVIKADERLSTVTAKAELFSQGGKKALEKGRIDSESARIILQDWFES